MLKNRERAMQILKLFRKDNNEPFDLDSQFDEQQCRDELQAIIDQIDEVLDSKDMKAFERRETIIDLYDDDKVNFEDAISELKLLIIQLEDANEIRNYILSTEEGRLVVAALKDCDPANHEQRKQLLKELTEMARNYISARDYISSKNV